MCHWLSSSGTLRLKSELCTQNVSGNDFRVISLFHVGQFVSATLWIKISVSQGATLLQRLKSLDS